MEMIFNEAMLDRIDADLASAIQGDRGARQRVYQKHMKWLLHYARYTNEQMRVAMAEYEYEYDALGEDSVAEPGSPTALAEDAAIAAAAEAEGENETPENPVEDASDESEETPETAEAEEGSSEETPEADEAE